MSGENSRDRLMGIGDEEMNGLLTPLETKVFEELRTFYLDGSPLGNRDLAGMFPEEIPSRKAAGRIRASIVSKLRLAPGF